MKSRKLRALALLLSAIMIITAVPSTMFAEDFVGETAGWDTENQEAEAPAGDDFDLGFGTDFEVEAEVEPTEFEGFDVFASDDLVAGVMDIAKETWDATTLKVTVEFSDKLTEVGDMNRLPYPDDCTKYYYTSTVTHAGETYVIYSTSNQNASGKIIEIVADGSDKIIVDNKSVDSGLYSDTTKTHVWDDGHEIVDVPSTCTADGSGHMEYFCKNGACKVVGIQVDAKGTIEIKTEANKTKGYPKPIAKSGHKKPSTGVVTSYIVSDTTDADFTASGKAAPVNSKVDATGAPLSIKADQDATYYVKSVYECTVCGQKVTDFDAKQIMALFVRYEFDPQVIKNTAVATKSLSVKNADGTSSTVSFVDGIGDWTTAYTNEANAGNNVDWWTPITVGTNENFDAKKFVLINDCAKEASYTEVWYYSDNPTKVVRSEKHTLTPHYSKTTYYLSNKIYEDNKANIQLSKNLAKTTALGYEQDANNGIEKYVRVKKNDSGKVTAVVSSLTCVEQPYYTVVRCNYCDKVLTITAMKAPANDEAHRLSVKANTLKTTMLDKAETSYAKLAGVDPVGDELKFENITADCYKEGTVDISYKCPVCGKWVSLVKGYKIDALGHDWKWENKEIKEATCSEDGYVIKENKCSRCGLVNEAAGTQKLTTAKIGHVGGVEKSDWILKISDSGDVVGLMTRAEKKRNGTEYYTFTGIDNISDAASSVVNKYDNTGEIGATLYKHCTLCGKDVPLKDLPDTATKKDNKTLFESGVKYYVNSIILNSASCNGGVANITVTYTTHDTTPKELTVTGDFDYWKNLNAFQARTQHAPKENADGSVVCVICGKVIKEAPVVTTVAPTTVEPTTVVTTEAPTTVAPTTVAPTTVEPTTVVTTEAPTTVAPVTVEPSTEITTVEPATMPAQVTGEKVTKNSPANGIIGVKYNAVEGADSYTVNVREPNGAWTKNPTNGAETAYEITGLTEGKCYDIRIAAVASGIAGSRSGHLYRWLKKVTLMKPTKIKDEAGAVNVTWDAADGATKYKLYVSSDKTFKKDVKKFKVTENTAKVSGLTAGTKYYFKVRCYTKGADGKTYTGGWSNVKSKTLK